MRREIARLHRQLAVTMIYVTHDQVEAMTLGDRIAVMHAGRVMQVASPSVLYDTPDNTFTAGFIGSPPMNLIPGRAAGGRLLVAGLDASLPLPAGPAEGAEVLLGVRPEHLEIVTADASGEGEGIPAIVEIAEPLGHEVLLGLRAGERELVARVAPDGAPKAGDRVLARPDRGRLLLFDAATGARIT
jgi:multiple sugar transport system ATP-binding protein